MRDPLKEYDISFTGLKPGKHQFIYKIDKKFFDHFDYDDVLDADVEIILDFDKKSNLFDLHFHGIGNVTLTCDVSNEPYEQPVENKFEVVVKFGIEYNDDNEELIILPFEEHKINVAQQIYELIVLAIPNKRIHPGVLDGTLQSETLNKLNELHPNKSKGNEIDPRWEELKKLVINKKP